VVGAKSTIPREVIQIGARVTLDMTTLTIMKVLKRAVDP
jgi:26S proteasome regulatory subunit T4